MNLNLTAVFGLLFHLLRSGGAVGGPAGLAFINQIGKVEHEIPDCNRRSVAHRLCFRKR